MVLFYLVDNLNLMCYDLSCKLYFENVEIERNKKNHTIGGIAKKMYI